MHRTPLAKIGTSGVELPPIIFGTSSFGNLYQETSDKTRLAILRQMLQHVPGRVAIDSAGKYGAGLALESLGKALNQLEVPHERVLISNKLGWRRTPLEGDEPTFELGVWIGLKHDAVQDISYDGILRCWEEGNRFLDGYSAQLLSVHDPDEYLAASAGDADRESRWEDILQAYRALGELRDRGDALAIGVGVKDWRIGQRLIESCDLDWVMIAACLTIYQHEPKLIEFVESLRERGVVVINSAVFHGGFLTGGEFFNYQPVNQDDHAELFQWRERFYAVCQRFNIKPAEACVAFGVSPPGVVSIALNTSRPEKVAVNARLASARLDEEFWRALKTDVLIRSDYPHL